MLSRVSDTRLAMEINSLLFRLVFFVVFFVVVFQEVSSSSSRRESIKASTNGTRVTDTLKFLIVVSRHGNRGGTKDYPFDPYPINNSTYWPYGVNGLTTNGRREMYKLGAKIRTLYNGFLNNMFYPDELYAASTAEERTLMSAESFLAGLYPPEGYQVWNKKVRWQPTPVYSNSSDMTPNILSCPRFVENVEESVKAFLNKYQLNIENMMVFYNNVTGGNATGLTAAKYLYHLGDKLLSEATEGYTIPKWTKAIYPKPLLSLVGKVYLDYFAGSVESVRLVIGKFFEEIVGVLNSKVNDSLSDSRRIHYYSGHDSSIVTLQVVLGVPSSKVVGLVRPGSALVLELHRNDTTSEFYVQPLYIDGSSAYLNPEALSILDCGTTCDYASFLSGTQNFTGVDYDAECQTTGSLSEEYLDLIKPFL